ncbi:hypothetical protein Ddye_012213 [Dipteronia dyeriana]|uniref:cytokinin riboside 5'-monophosphate phosphoribohydrolase n=1 Tax=Dipteronia dyeriana TaxID=168575 RepID=A0AAD9X439_9ROSI|nr:hypothetical protein Ddye_012213 [Dipteronia dyeriana]
MAAVDIIEKINDEELVVSGMQKRLNITLHHADAFIALPDGFGTLEEIFTMASWVQLHIHEKPIGLLNVNNFYDDQKQLGRKNGQLEPGKAQVKRKALPITIRSHHQPLPGHVQLSWPKQMEGK